MRLRDLATSNRGRRSVVLLSNFAFLALVRYAPAVINIAGLEKRFGPQILFSDVALQLNPRERYGLVGANGSGKSTFLKLLTADEGTDGGTITFGKKLRLGVLRQDQFVADDLRILDVAMMGDQEVYSALHRVDEIALDEQPDADEIAHLNELIATFDGYTLESRARETLLGLGLLTTQIEQRLGTLSGGFKLRVLLAQVLVGRPDVLLLDEPTNHLDILSIRWLEQFLKSFPGCAVVISHDRRFLDGVSTRILDVDYQTVTDYPGNYTQFVVRKELNQKQRNTEIERAEKKIAEKQAFVERFRAKATKARQAQSRAKQIEKIEVAEVVRSSRRAPLFLFQQERPTGRDVISISGLSKSYGQKSVLFDVKFQVRRGEKVAIIGKNGIGKSTLLKILSDNLSSDAGQVEWGVHTKVGYFAQDHHDLLHDPEVTPLSYVWDLVPHETTSYVRGQLGRMLFTGDDVEKKVTTLSGGEAARLIFASLAVTRPNVLLLDEPTNHLDLETIDALALTLKNYEGTLLFVSHDRWFVSQIADRIIELKDDGVHDFSGTYQEYLERDGADHLDTEQVVLAAKKEKKVVVEVEVKRQPESQAEKPRSPEISYEERKRRANRVKTLPKKLDSIMADIERLEAERTAIQTRYTEPNFFTSVKDDEQRKMHYREAELGAEIDEMMQQWEEVESELKELGFHK